MSVELRLEEKYWDLELGGGAVRCDCDEYGVLPTCKLDADKVIESWYSIQHGHWKKTLLVSLPSVSGDLEPQLDFKVLLGGDHRMEVSVSLKEHGECGDAELARGNSKLSVYQSRVAKPHRDGNFAGQIYVNRDPLVIRKAQVLVLSIELRSELQVLNEFEEALMIELCVLGKTTTLLYQLVNLSDSILSA